MLEVTIPPSPRSVPVSQSPAFTGPRHFPLLFPARPMYACAVKHQADCGSDPGLEAIIHALVEPGTNGNRGISIRTSIHWVHTVMTNFGSAQLISNAAFSGPETVRINEMPYDGRGLALRIGHVLGCVSCRISRLQQSSCSS